MRSETTIKVTVETAQGEFLCWLQLDLQHVQRVLVDERTHDLFDKRGVPAGRIALTLAWEPVEASAGQGRRLVPQQVPQQRPPQQQYPNYAPPPPPGAYPTAAPPPPQVGVAVVSIALLVDCILCVRVSHLIFFCLADSPSFSGCVCATTTDSRLPSTPDDHGDLCDRPCV